MIEFPPTRRFRWRATGSTTAPVGPWTAFEWAASIVNFAPADRLQWATKALYIPADQAVYPSGWASGSPVRTDHSNIEIEGSLGGALKKGRVTGSAEERT